MVSPFDVQHRDCFESLAAMRDAGGADLILTSPPYPDARSDEAYGASFDTSLVGYAKLGDAVFDALKPGGVCALNIDGPVREWRGKSIGSERSLIAFEVALDWAKRVGFRYIEHCAYVREGQPGKFGPRWRSGWEPVHVFARPGSDVHFDAWGLSKKTAGTSDGRTRSPRARNKSASGWSTGTSFKQKNIRTLSTAVTALTHPGSIDHDHPAPFPNTIGDAFVRCYAPPGGLVGDPFVGSGTVAFAVHRAGDGRTFIGGDLGTRQTHNGKPCGRRWADIVNDGLRQGRLFS